METIVLFNSLLLIVALAADAFIGDPPTWPHMVRLMGKAVESLETVLRKALPHALRLADACWW
jgi:adenosylcobinamide-phosphate synthase